MYPLKLLAIYPSLYWQFVGIVDTLAVRELVHDDPWLIVCIEAAWYCKSRHVDYIRYYQLKTRSEKVLNRETNGARSDFGGSYASIFKSHRYEKFFSVKRDRRKNETRVYPNIPAIQNEIGYRKRENLDSRNKRILRIINQVDTVNAKRSIVNSLFVSAGLEVRVKRANPDKATSTNDLVAT